MMSQKPTGSCKSYTSLKSEDNRAGTESLEEASVDYGNHGNEVLDLDIDSDLENFDQEPETWGVTIDRKVLMKMSRKDIKRQVAILELIQGERRHMCTLKIMQQVFYSGLKKQANYPNEILDQLFPRINELVEISSRFHQNLKCRQDDAGAVQKIGDVIIDHFSGENGERFKEAYGEFASKQPEAVAMYKHCFKTDTSFANFIEKCHGHRIVPCLFIPGCYTLVIERMIMYPIFIEAITKPTKASNTDKKDLQKSLLLVKDILQAVDNAIKDYEKQLKLKDIKMRMEKGSVVLKNGQEIKNSHFVDYQSKMVYDGILNWKNDSGRLTETYVVVLESMVVFLQENDKTFSLLSIDGKSPCIPLKTLMVRKVATDKNAIFFVTMTEKGPEIYEIVCSNPKVKRRQWFSIISDAIQKAPEETGNIFQSPEEERKLAEELELSSRK